MALQFINARPDSIATMEYAERIDDPDHISFPPTFRFRWRRHSIVFDRESGNKSLRGLHRDVAHDYKHSDDSTDGEFYSFAAIDDKCLACFDEFQEREKWTDT